MRVKVRHGKGKRRLRLVWHSRYIEIVRRKNTDISNQQTFAYGSDVLDINVHRTTEREASQKQTLIPRSKSADKKLIF